MTIDKPTYNADGTKQRKTLHWNNDMSDRHRQWGNELYMTDHDCVHFNRDGYSTDHTSWKARWTKQIDFSSPEAKNHYLTADILQIPFFILFFDSNDFTYRIGQYNKNPNVKRWIPIELQEKASGAVRIKERDLIQLYHKIRNITPSKEVLNRANINLPDWKVCPIINF